MKNHGSKNKKTASILLKPISKLETIVQEKNSEPTEETFKSQMKQELKQSIVNRKTSPTKLNVHTSNLNMFPFNTTASQR